MVCVWGRGGGGGGGVEVAYYVYVWKTKEMHNDQQVEGGRI